MDLASIEELSYNAIMVGFPLLAFSIILGAVWANYALGGSWSDYQPKMVDLQELDCGVKKGQ